jgi:dTDP-4-dehydrorhamnose reductase
MASLVRRFEVHGVDRHPWWGDEPMHVLIGELDEPAFFERAVQAEAPDILIHCAAWVNVDACEQEPSRAYAANAALTRRLVRAVGPHCLVVYLSTDGVFPGEAPLAREEDPTAPPTVYGRTKVQGEQEVAQATENHLIVRTNFYGWSSGRKTTFGEWLYRALARREPVTLFTDFFFTPIYVVDFVERLMRLLEGPFRGIVHLGGGDRLSKHAFGLLMAEVGGLSAAHIRAGSIDQMPWLARRPKDMSLSSERFARLTGCELPEARAGLQRFLADRSRPLSARCAPAEAKV